MSRDSFRNKKLAAGEEGYKKFRLVTQRPVAVIMTTLAVIVFGYVSYNKLSLNLMPDISYPTLTIRTEFEGTAPEEIENLVSRPLEQILAVVRNKTSISSISRAGQSDVILEFTWDTDMNVATQDVRELLEQFHPPEGAKKPLVLRYDPTLDPIIRLGLYSREKKDEGTLFSIREIADEEIKRDLEALTGVAAVKVKGGLEEEIVIDLDEKELSSLGLDINQINQRLAAENVNLAGGNLEEGDTEYLVRTLNLFMSIDEIANLIILRREGAEVRLKDIAKVYKSHKEREVMTRVNGQEAVELEIYKEADANLVQLAQSLKEYVFGTPEQQALFKKLQQQKAKEKEETRKAEKSSAPAESKADTPRIAIEKPVYIAANLPEGIDIALLSDQSTFIENSLNEVRQTAILGGFFAIIVLFFFLRNGYSTFIIALSIPISVIATFAPMNLFSVTLNMMSLGGLALGIGMLVDNSIVVLESIFRCREEGDDVTKSAVRGAGEVGGAVTASTLTTIAVFLPIVFVEGVAGQLFGDLSLTVVFSLFMSLIVALYFIPMMASRDFKSYGMRGKLKSNLFNIKTEEWIEKNLKKYNLQGFTTFGQQGQPVNDSRSFLQSVIKACIFFAVTIALFAESVFRFLILFLGSLALAIKFLLLFILMPIHLIASIIIVWLKKDKSETVFTSRFALSNFRFVKIDYIWEDLLTFSSFSDFSKSIYGLKKSLVTKKIKNIREKSKKGILRTVQSIIAFIFSLFLTIAIFIFQVIFSLFIRLFVHALLKIGLLFIIGFNMFLTNFVKLFTYILRGVFGPILYLFDIGFEYIKKVYPTLLIKALDNQKAVIGGAAAAFILTMIFIFPMIGTELIPEMHQGEFNVDLRMPIGTPLETTDESTLPIDNYISNLKGIDMRATVIGAEKTSSASSEEGEHTAKITIRLKRSEENLINREEEMIGKIREYARHQPQIETKISRPALFSFKTPIEVEIKGYNLQELKTVTDEVVRKMENIEGLYDVRTSLQSGNPEIHIIYDRERLSKYGLNISHVAEIIRNKVLGYVPTKFNKEDRKIEIRVKVKESDRNTIKELAQLNIAPSALVPIPLQAVADLKQEEGPSEILRLEQQRAAVVTANVGGLDLGSAARNILAELKELKISADFSIDISGQNKEMEVSMRSLMMALILAIFLVYTVMAMLFESVIQPFIIILTIPLALLGVILVLWIGGIPLSVVVGIGVIVLVGIVVNNAIVLVDYTNTLRKRGLSIREAIIQAGSVRLRPILMTTTTTVLGLLPMALGLGEGAEIRTPMAWTIIAGLISSTALTLIIIPSVYNIVTDFVDKKKKRT